MKTFVLDRSRWYRGKSADESALRRSSDGLMCCLGLYLESCGVPEERLTDRKYPSGAKPLPEEAAWLAVPEPPGVAQSATTVLATTNDNEHISEAKREKRIQRMFAKHGVAVSFVDRASPSGGDLR